jgi:hypothetical protein
MARIGASSPNLNITSPGSNASKAYSSLDELLEIGREIGWV